MDHIPVMLANSTYAILGVMGPVYEYPRLRDALLKRAETSTYATLRRVFENYSINWREKTIISVRPRKYESRLRGATHLSIQHGQTVPVDAAPVDVTSVNVAPVDAAPVDVAPVDVAPVDVAPVDVAPVDAAAVANTGKSDESPTCFQASTSVANEGEFPSQSTSSLSDSKAAETSVSAETNEENTFATTTLDIDAEPQASCQPVDVKESLGTLNETTGSALDTTDNNPCKSQFIPIDNAGTEALNDPQRVSQSIASVGGINGEYNECPISLESPAAENLETPLPTAELSMESIPNVPESRRKIIPLTALSSRRRSSINKINKVNFVSRIPRSTKRRAKTTLRTDAPKKARVDTEISTCGKGNSEPNPAGRKDGHRRLDRMGATKRKLGYVNSKVTTLSTISILIVATEIASCDSPGSAWNPDTWCSESRAAESK
jgi:hypothetical protein